MLHKYLANGTAFCIENAKAANNDNLLIRSTPLIFRKYINKVNVIIVNAIIIIPGDVIKTELIVWDFEIYNFSNLFKK